MYQGLIAAGVTRTGYPSHLCVSRRGVHEKAGAAEAAPAVAREGQIPMALRAF